MAMIIDSVVGAAIEGLLDTVLEIKDKAVKFRPTLERLETTLKTLKPLINQIQGFDKQLDRPKEETERLIKQMEKGKKLVVKCSKVQWWDCWHKANYQEELEELYNSICDFFKLELQAINSRDVKETLVVVRDIQVEIRRQNNNNMVARNDRVELRALCSPPQPPTFTVGLDVHLKQLKLKLLENQVDPLVLTVTGSGGSGKSTLAKKLCWDDEVRGILMNSHPTLILMMRSYW